MQPIHEGLPKEALFNTGNFRSVAICLDSGKLATNACKRDARGDDSRVAYVNVYNEDVPNETCDKHVQVEYCVTGGGVANEYCGNFPEAKIESRSLVKLTQGEVNEIRSAANVGLNDIYLKNGYVWYLDGNWYGFNGNSNHRYEEPYLVCPKHNAAAWRDYLEESGQLDWDDEYDQQEDNRHESSSRDESDDEW